MKVLATDLDRTLLPNGTWPASPGAIEAFNELTERHGIIVVYVTGRNLALTEEAIQTYGIRRPHYLISDVGASIRECKTSEWPPLKAWATHLERACPRWNPEGIRRSLSDIDGVTRQPDTCNGPFKQSFFVDPARHASILAGVKERAGDGFDAHLIYSHDPQTDQGLLDFLPNKANKQTALEFLAETLRLPREDIVFCGDSGNDIDPLTAGFRGVMVRNADEQLVKNVQAAISKQPNLTIYHARGGFKGMNGNYTSGVLEGAAHYGLFESS